LRDSPPGFRRFGIARAHRSDELPFDSDDGRARGRVLLPAAPRRGDQACIRVAFTLLTFELGGETSSATQRRYPHRVS